MISPLFPQLTYLAFKGFKEVENIQIEMKAMHSFQSLHGRIRLDLKFYVQRKIKKVRKKFYAGSQKK